MRKGRPKVAVILTTEERRRLDSLAHRSRSAAALARRARIILACAEGIDSKVVARRLHVTPGTVCKWRGRFITDRLDGLYDEPRPGARCTITDDQVEHIGVLRLHVPRNGLHDVHGLHVRVLPDLPAGVFECALDAICRAVAPNPYII